MKLLSFTVVQALLLGVGSAARLVAVEIDPIGLGSYAIASTNLEIKPRDDAPMFDYLNGQMTAERTVYLTDILTHPAAVPTLQIAVPANPQLFHRISGKTIPVVLFVMYPTTADNPWPDYTFPYKDTGDKTVPHMQPPGLKPIFAAPGKFPLIVLSGGYNTHALWHFDHMKQLASHGYIVVDIQHGDGRGPSFEGNLALRSIELKAAIDWALNDPDFAPAIDANRIGAFGQSGGGYTIAAALGATDPTGRVPTVADSRVKMGVGNKPFFGASSGSWPMKVDLWFFGEDHAGMRAVRAPLFLLYGGRDTNVRPEDVEAGAKVVAGPVIGVKLDGETHKSSDASRTDMLTWEVLAFDAWLRDDPSAKKTLETATSVKGGVTDHVSIRRP